MTAAKRTATKPVAKKITKTKVAAKSKVTKPKASAKPAASHPPFKQMIVKAIGALNEKGGSSRQAVLKYICANYSVEAKTGNKYLKSGLVNGVNNGSLKRVKGVGASGSFKIAEKVKPKASKPKAVKVKPTKVKPVKKAAPAAAASKADPKKKTKSKAVKPKAKKSAKKAKKA